MPSPVHPYSEYGVALRTLRSARSWLGIGLFVCVCAQVLGFFLMWATTQPYPGLRAQYEPRSRFDELQDRFNPIPDEPLPTTGPATLPATLPGPHSATQAAPAAVAASGKSDAPAATPLTAPHASRTATAEKSSASRPTTSPAAKRQPFFPGAEDGQRLRIHSQWKATYTMCVPLTQMVGLMAVCSQVIVMFLTLLLILVAQAPGVVHVTRGLIWSILLLFMVMPWQYFARNFPFPGVLFGYEELLERIAPHVVLDSTIQVYGYQKLLVYGRFVIWPAAAMVVLLIVAERFRAGIMLAIGHPLQSMLQPRGPGSPKPPAPVLPDPMGRKLS